MLRIAIVVPPMSNLNTPYSAVPRLAGWLRKLGHTVTPVDLSLELFLRVFSRHGLKRLFDAVDPSKIFGQHEDVYVNRARYVSIIDELVAFLQGRDLAFAPRILRGDLIPEGPRFCRLDTPRARREMFGGWGMSDHARHLATLAVGDLVDLFQLTISPHFAFLTYAEKLVMSETTFDRIDGEVARPANAIEELLVEAAMETIPEVDLVCLTVPFPGMFVGALRIGKWLGTARPATARALGGGYPSTELRSITDARLFEYVDYLSLDDGEIPLQQICRRLEGDQQAPLARTFTREAGRVVWHDSPECASPRFRDLPTPDYGGLRTDRYIHTLGTHLNPVVRLLNEGLWLKLTAAHGCYWKKCTFCDIHLPYIQDFDPLSAQGLADQMDAMHDQTGLSSFHFTDEAAPPPLLVNLALELLRRGRTYQFYGNIRYDPGFTPGRCRLLAAAGMVAVTGGIEVASDELLPKIAKGITVPQVVKVLQAFSEAKILTHAYLIYGFPGETKQDTVNSLEILRQLMSAKLLLSGLYHLFSLTKHSPIGRNPELFGIRARRQPTGFADYNMQYDVFEGERPSTRIAEILQYVLSRYVAGVGLDRDVMSWFQRGELPPPSVPRDHVATLMEGAHPKTQTERLCWLGGAPRWSHGLLSVSSADGDFYTAPTQRSVADNLTRCHPTGWRNGAPPRLNEFDGLDWIGRLAERGLVVV